MVLVANKMVDDTTVSDAEFERIPGTDVWALLWEVEPTWRSSYQIAVVDDAPADPVRVAAVADRRRRALAATAMCSAHAGPR